MTAPRVEIVVARADNDVIGMGGELPWHLPRDLRHFKSVTMGAPMIMGRKTFESLKRVLPGRRHIVLTNDGAWWRDGIDIAHSIEEAIELVDTDRVSIIGGAEIYRQFLPVTDKIHLTEVHLEPDGDTFFPKLDKSEWLEIRTARAPAEGKYPAHSFVTLIRRSSLSEP